MSDKEPQTATVSILRTTAYLLVGCSLFLPIGILSIGGLMQLGYWPSAAAPFGLNRIAIAYVLLSAPLVWITARAIATVCSPFWESVTIIGILAGLLFAAASIGSFSYSNVEFGDTWMVRHLSRAAWVAALQFPFVISATLLLRKSNLKIGADEQAIPQFRKLDFVISILLISVVPQTFNDFVVRRQMVLLDEATRNLQLTTALQVVSRLNLFNCSVPDFAPEDKGVSELARGDRQRRNSLFAREQMIRQTITETEIRIASYPASTTDDQTVGLALDHYSLGHLNVAERILSENNLASSHEWGALVMGYVAEQQQRPKVAAEHYQRAIELEAATESPRANRLSSAYERLANSLRASQQGVKAETILKDGIEKYPVIADRLNLQLGEHYLQAGRPNEAAEVFRSLASRDDVLGVRARTQLKTINSSMGGCFVRTPRPWPRTAPSSREPPSPR